MSLAELRVENLRCIEAAEIEFSPDLNLISGEKTREMEVRRHIQLGYPLNNLRKKVPSSGDNNSDKRRPKAA